MQNECQPKGRSYGVDFIAENSPASRHLDYGRCHRPRNIGGGLNRLGAYKTTESDIGERRQLVDFVFGVMLYKLAFAKIRLVALGGQIKCEPSI